LDELLNPLQFSISDEEVEQFSIATRRPEMALVGTDAKKEIEQARAVAAHEMKMAELRLAEFEKNEAEATAELQRTEDEARAASTEDCTARELFAKQEKERLEEAQADHMAPGRHDETMEPVAATKKGVDDDDDSDFDVDDVEAPSDNGSNARQRKRRDTKQLPEAGPANPSGLSTGAAGSATPYHSASVAPGTPIGGSELNG
jgi:membrane protein involved in colicin uptake